MSESKTQREYSALTINLTSRLREGLQQLADERASSLSQVLRQAAIDAIERSRRDREDRNAGR